MGTRFRLFVQPPFGDAHATPEIITVSSPPGSLGPGPSDDSMYVVEPVDKALPYGLNQGPLGTPYIYLPPWPGRHLAPAQPGADGHFDHYRPGTPGFEAAHLFGCVRFTLDVWENYLGQPLVWHFRDDYDRLELSILPEWDNAQFGYGFLEVGSEFADDGTVLPFSLDFDIIAHEVGHAIVYSMLGVPSLGTEHPEYVGFQESFSDCVSLIAAMHFPSVIENVLTETRGNLYLANRLERFSEFSPHTQIRSASNKRTMADFVDGWKNEHDLSEPLTGAIFDILVDIFHESLVGRGLIPPQVEALADVAEFDAAAAVRVQAAFDQAFVRNTDGFREALLDARDVVGTYLAETLWALTADFLDYGDVAETMLAVDWAETGGAFGEFMRENFARRYIGILHAPPRPELPVDRKRITRLLLPQDRRLLPRMSYREAYSLSHQLTT
jgi:hypothetical protein